MTPENFVYWLQGFFEVANPETLTKEQITEIRNHLSLVLTKKTPSVTPKLSDLYKKEIMPTFPPFTIDDKPAPNPYYPDKNDNIIICSTSNIPSC